MGFSGSHNKHLDLKVCCVFKVRLRILLKGILRDYCFIVLRIQVSPKVFETFAHFWVIWLWVLLHWLPVFVALGEFICFSSQLLLPSLFCQKNSHQASVGAENVSRLLRSCAALQACIWGSSQVKSEGFTFCSFLIKVSTRFTFFPSSPVVLSHAQWVEATRAQQHPPQPV